jgi:hypothetical protein
VVVTVDQVPLWLVSCWPLTQIDAQLSTFHCSCPSPATSPSMLNSSRAIQILLVRCPVDRPVEDSQSGSNG